MLQTIQSTFFTGVLILLSLCVIACHIAAIKGPSLGDRMVAANMTGTLTIIAICVLAWHLNEGWLVDVALIYAMLSFIAVVVLTKIFIGSYKSSSEDEEEDTL